MSAIEVKRNPSRRRYYGLDVGDRVKQRIMDKTFIFGTVVELGGFDNNRVYVIWDGNTEASAAVAEWCTRINENGLEINRIVNRFVSGCKFDRVSEKYFNHLCEREEVTVENVIEAFESYPGVELVKEAEGWRIKTTE